MTDDTPEENKALDKAKDVAGKAMQTADNVGKVAEGAGNIFGAIKWVAIAVTFGLIFFGGMAIYKAVTAPVKAVGNAAEAITDTVKSGTSSVKDGAAEIINRLIIPTSNQRELNLAAEAAFKTVANMAETQPETMKERVFWTANFGGHENKVCELSMSFGGDELPVFIAADNKDYATSKSLGSKKDRLMRILIRADGDNLALNTEWDDDASAWIMKWKSTTIKKSLDDKDAETRLLDVLEAAEQSCN